MAVYDSAYIYIQGASKLCDKIVRIDAIIDALEDVSLKAAATDNIEEYWLDDGQSKIRTMYKGADDVAKSIHQYEKIRTRYVNRLNGRIHKRVPSSSFRRR